jgi:hypothetical protein
MNLDDKICTRTSTPPQPKFLQNTNRIEPRKKINFGRLKFPVIMVLVQKILPAAEEPTPSMQTGSLGAGQ